MIRCIVCHNDEQVKTYEILDSLITIGRLPENTISIANMGISRRHVRIDRDVNRNYILSDLNSLNGTLVNNQKVKRATLAPGDRIIIGKYSILIEDITSDDVAPAVSAQTPETIAPPGTETADSVQKEPFVQQPSDPDVKRDGPVFIETNKHTVYPLTKRVMSVGNSEDDDIFVAGFMIGDGHVIIERRDDGIWATCPKKSGRFKVNGKKANNHRLKHKERIEIGGSVFVYMENG
jgi:pSer/pThr/pTyr-binding forkhead associated (FHA) protein